MRPRPRQNSLLISRNDGNRLFNVRSLRSPPPNPPARDIPPIPRFPRPEDQDTGIPGPSSSVMLDSFGSSDRAPFTNHDLMMATAALSPPDQDPLPIEYRPRAAALAESDSFHDEMPPLQRVSHRSMTHSPSRMYSDQAAADRLRDPDAPSTQSRRGRTATPDADQWETLLTTITPDPSLPSASSSFNTTASPRSRPADRSEQPRRAPSLRRQASSANLRAPLAPPSPEPSQSDGAAVDDELCPAEIAPGDSATPEDGMAGTRRVPRQRRILLHHGPAHDVSLRSAIADPDEPESVLRSTFQYEQLIEAAHAFHHAFEHLDYHYADFVNSYLRYERGPQEADEVIAAMDEITEYLTCTFESTLEGQRQDEARPFRRVLEMMNRNLERTDNDSS